MKVDYLDHMGDDLTVVDAARVSFDKKSTWSIVADDEGYAHKTLPYKDQKLLHYLAEHQHWTPFSHPQVSIRVTAPLYVRSQLFKHKVGGTENEVSRRYVSNAPVMDIPKKWRKRAENIKQGSSDELVRVDKAFQKQIDTTMENVRLLYEDLLMMGVCPEQARAVLPVCTETSWVWTGSLMFFARVCKLRLDSHAQKETRDVAEEISKIMYNLFPVCWPILVGEHERSA